MTDDLSQCGNCIYHYTYNGRDMCKQVGDDFYLQWKVENCPYHTSITKVAAISDEIYRLKAENAALKEKLEKAVELPCKIGDKFYVVNYYPPELNEEECCDFSFIELSKILLDNGCGVTYELGDNGCFFVTLDKNEAIRIYNQKKEEQND